MNPDGTPAVESPSTPGLPLQVICYERADDIGFGVSGVVTRARGIRATFPDLDPGQIPMAAPVQPGEGGLPARPGRRQPPLARRCGLADALHPRARPRTATTASSCPTSPPFLHKHGGLVLSLGQFMQWVGSELMASGTVQIWPGIAGGGSAASTTDERVRGVRLLDQGVDREGNPDAGFMPGMDIHAALTVVGDGPVGAVGRQLDEAFRPARRPSSARVGRGHEDGGGPAARTPIWSPAPSSTPSAIPSRRSSASSTCIPDRVASVGIFVPSWFDSPVRTSYRYLQHCMLHPYLWRYLKGGKLRSWGAKSLQESGKRGEPLLAGDGYARIGEGSGSTNVLTGSGVDEAWTTGAQLAEAVLELLQAGKPFTRENLERDLRGAPPRELGGRGRPHRRKGSRRLPARRRHRPDRHGAGRLHQGQALRSAASRSSCPSSQEYYRGHDSAGGARAHPAPTAAAAASSCHDALMERCGWPAIPYDGQLLVSHQDALLMGGKVQAPAGFADHVRFLYPDLCERCGAKLCIEMCSGQAITPGAGRRARVRPREVRPLRRLPVELRHLARRRSAARQHRLPRRRRRPALGGKLMREDWYLSPLWGRMVSCAAIDNRRASRLSIGSQGATSRRPQPAGLCPAAPIDNRRAGYQPAPQQEF